VWLLSSSRLKHLKPTVTFTKRGPKVDTEYFLKGVSPRQTRSHKKVKEVLQSMGLGVPSEA